MERSERHNAAQARYVARRRDMMREQDDETPSSLDPGQYLSMLEE